MAQGSGKVDEAADTRSTGRGTGRGNGRGRGTGRGAAGNPASRRCAARAGARRSAGSRPTAPAPSLPRVAMAAEMLDAETELQLARAWHDHGDQAARQRLVLAYMRLAVAMAARFRRYQVPAGDLLQEATLGLLKAADRFDPERGVRFSTYAVWWIRAAIQDHVLRNWSLVRTGSTSSQKTLFFGLRRAEARIARDNRNAGRELEQGELRALAAERLRVPVAEAERMAGRLAGGDFSLDAPQSSDAEGRSWLEALEDPRPQASEQVAARHDLGRLRGWLAEGMARLTARERLILRARRLSEPGRTLESLGGELGLSKERVRQIEAAAFAKLRRYLEEEADEALLLL